MQQMQHCFIERFILTNYPASNAEWVALIREGFAGNPQAFQLRLSRLIARLRREKSNLAEILSKALSEANENKLTLARDSANQQAHLRPVDADTDLPLTTVEYPVLMEHKPVWTKDIDISLHGLINEWVEAGKLLEAGLNPSRTLLLSGPPGVGKTLAANYLAEQLNLPLVTMNLAAAVNSLLGRTGNKLVRVLTYAQVQPCVLLLDEFDAFAKRRDDVQDVGELKRVVNVLLQAIDEWPSTSLLVAATNHEDLLDRAIFRRFDLWLRFPDSTKDQVEKLLMQLGCDQGLASKLSPVLIGKPLSDASKLVTRAKRQVILKGATFERAMLDLLMPEELESDDMQEYLEIKRLQADGKSLRAIGKELNMNASTISRKLKKINKGK